MADLSLLAERFASGVSQQGQPVTEMVNARLQRIQELERIRQEHSSELLSSVGDSATRHSRRDRFTRQSGQRSTERRSLTSNVQRTPVRSQSFENASNIANVNEDTLNFRDMFESARETLFGPRANGSSESLNGRRSSDSPLTVNRATFQTGSDSGSGSSTPRGSGTNSTFASGLADAFSNIRSALIRSDSTGALRETRRSASITRESSSMSNVQRTPGINLTGNSTVTRSSSLRESRFRRRTIQGVDSNVSRALEQEKSRTGSSIPRSISPLVIDPTSTVSSGLSGSSSISQTRESSRSTVTSYSSSYTGRQPRKIDLYPEDSVPVLGLEKEKQVFVDNQGKCHWLDKTHTLIRELKSTKRVPEIVIKSRLAITDEESSDGFIASMDGDEKIRYGKLRDLVVLAKKRDANFRNGDSTDSFRSLSLLELYERGDFIENLENASIDEMYKSFSLYTEPRPRQNIESILAEKKVLPIYDGIPRSELPQEIKDKEDAALGRNPNQGIRDFANMDFSSLSSSRTVTNGEAKRTEQRWSDVRHEQRVDDSFSADYSRSEELHEASETHFDEYGNETIQHGQSHTQMEQAEIRHDDDASSMFRRRAEARRQQYLTSVHTNEDGSSLIQRRAEERRQRYLAEQQTNQNGSVTARSRTDDVQQRISSQSHTNENGSTIQTHSEERRQQYFTSETNNTENGSSSVRQVEQSSMIRQSSQSNIVRQSSQPPIDNSDIHSEVNLVMERLHMMQENSDMPLDTSHLDYEEMLMIQKALAENPSPPESPVAFESEGLNTVEITSVSDVETSTNQTEETTDITTVDELPISQPEESSTPIITYEEFPIDTNVRSSVTESSENSKTENTMAVVRLSSDNVIDSNIGSTTLTSDSTFLCARESVITHTRLEDDSKGGEDMLVETKVDSIETSTSENTVDKAVSSDNSTSVKDGVIESRSPRYQRLPSEGGECRLPLPSMDWSPLERSNSPISPKRFSFEDKKSENTSSASSTASDAAVSKFTVPKTLPQTGTRLPYESELTIEIPSDSHTTSQSLQNETVSTENQFSANQNVSNKNDTETDVSPAAPLDKHVSSVSSESEAPSPSEYETVTTVFEEFVHNIPLSVLQQMNAKDDD